MANSNKKLVSVRLTTTDLIRIKRIATRLGVRDSDIIRFALKTMLGKLAPLHNEDLYGSELLPVFVEIGAELTDYFEIDSTRLDGIINNGVSDQEKRVQLEEIDLVRLLRQIFGGGPAVGLMVENERLAFDLDRSDLRV